ncbi:MAG: hypothetical protein ABL995_05115 [Bryobacteraceae bacterium]
MLVETEANLVQVRRILESKTFRTSEVHRNLLNYLAEKSLSGEADQLKEYTVGLDVFQKPSSYDPRQESVVRMHMARLRQKLGEYYRTEGLEDPVIVDLPKGAFKVTFENRPAAPEPEPPVHVITQIPAPSYKVELVLAALLIAAVAFATYFGLRLREVQKSVSIVPPTWTTELQELWEPLLGSDRPLVVCLATESGDGSRANSMTGLATANGAFLLGQFLSDHIQNVYVTGSDSLSMPEVAMGNVVYLGGTATRLLRALPVELELTPEAGGIRNIHPASGEPKFFADPPSESSPNGRNSRETHALITHAPGVNGKGDVLYMSGSHVSDVTAGVEAFTDPVLAKMLVAKMKKKDGSLPRYYQIVLRVRSMDDTPIETAYLAHKELKALKQPPAE